LFSALDVKTRAEETGVAITDPQSIAAVNLLADFIDAETGLSWRTVDYAIQEVTK